MERRELKKMIREWMDLGFIEPDDIPSMDLYMDQITKFMDKHLEPNKRTEEDKTLTKTMINNYSKNNLLPPSNKKRYSKEHIILLIYIYYLKNVISISDIQTMLNPLIDDYFDNPKASHSLEDIYTDLYDMVKREYFNVEQSVVKDYASAEKKCSEKDDPYIMKLHILSLLGYDIFMKRKLMEKIIDEMRAEQEAKKEAEEKKEKAKQEREKREKAKAKASARTNTAASKKPSR